VPENGRNRGRMNLIIPAILIAMVIILSSATTTDGALVWGNDKPLGYTHKTEICAIIPIEPYYDCNFKWIVVMIPANSFLIPYTNTTVHGLADWQNYGLHYSNLVKDLPEDAEDRYSGMVVIGKNITDNCYEYKCLPLFIHEAMHIWCECNWHEDLKSAYRLDKEKEEAMGKFISVGYRIDEDKIPFT